jgi:membrane associated rhomboid family serine protease
MGWFSNSRSGPGTGWQGAVIALLIAVNVAIFAVMMARVAPAGGPRSMDLWNAGALFAGALAPAERWRLFAYGFLHLNLLHLASNMLCLALFGWPLLQRVGSLSFVIIYGAAIVVGGLVSIRLHETAFLTVGASGGTSGLLGALAYFTLAGKAAVPLEFLMLNIGLNIVAGQAGAGIDWACHLGGFAGGLVACAALDMVSSANRWLLRTKFPGHIALNGAVLLAAPWLVAAMARFTPDALDGGRGTMMAVGYATACILLIKLADVVLSGKHGLAIVIAALMAGNVAAVAAGAVLLRPAVAGACLQRGPVGAMTDAAKSLCQYQDGMLVALAALILTAIWTVYAWDFKRGWADVGFVATTLKAERRRCQGL